MFSYVYRYNFINYYSTCMRHSVRISSVAISRITRSFLCFVSTIYTITNFLFLHFSYNKSANWTSESYLNSHLSQDTNKMRAGQLIQGVHIISFPIVLLLQHTLKYIQTIKYTCAACSSYKLKVLLTYQNTVGV